ncbi:hypothetical protein FAZ19_19780 [Sphingobacterium alkalisoli]|uniref:Uncharacterized protein n=1 Tax=Sphingobacterium alkalisoli TaxID=1874115 RepID=A0A4U0GUF0_9SPHI|nr:hypothetical protein [Sphingobacterium alkalisoli]TJY62711.1 hypothetical protein FAZ19_19780 [Sphingobacterium alkalisoli]GGH28361.1 hypothetical protein GCM10011418_38970 [Sphingobacterium alkalisoli]
MKNTKIELMVMTMLLGILIFSSCEKPDLPRYDQPDYAMLFIYDQDGELVYASGVMPLDTVEVGGYKIVYRKRSF